MILRRYAALLTLALYSLPAMAVELQDPNDALICHDQPVKLDLLRYVRAASLDLRGHMPRADELESIELTDEADTVPEALLDNWLASEAFIDQAVRRHRTYFWNNLSQVDMFQPQKEIRATGNIFWSPRKSRVLRSGSNVQVRCFDEPAQFDAAGRPVTRLDENGYRREGWVEVNPYWAPNTTVRVCAFDAQTAQISSAGRDCRTGGGNNDEECGCGPNLNWCATSGIERRIKRSMATSLEQLIAAAVGTEGNYLDLFESRRGFADGALVHYYRHLRYSTRFQSTPSPITDEALPDVPYPDTNWHEFELGRDHAGALTHPAYLLRFQTNRARASRFYEEFLCAPFVPPTGGLPAASDESARDPDLQVRAGCKYCHAQLEPAASHWGRWTEQGVGYLNTSRFPALNQDCLDCALGGRCNAFCRNNYVTRALSEKEEPYLGMLQSYAFRRSDHMHYVEQGPKLIARKAVAENTLPRCVARQTAEWLMGRAATSDDDHWILDLAQKFVRSGFDYRGLVKAVILSPQYRRVQ